MPSVALRRSKRLTPLPALGPLYLVGVAICGTLVVEALVDGRYADPMLIPSVVLLIAAYAGLRQGVYLVGDQLILRFGLGRTVVALSRVREFTIRPRPGRAGKRLLHLELLDGTQVPTSVGVSRNLFSPVVRLPFEKLVALVEQLDVHRRQSH
ncbi:hypothetical protein [Catellatospora sichuanensis]|uniref:hypothetical protein n=1 Tax=Catellatospora sichuanensis TaxID=1969805 RepID=UPI00118304C2|nr:hypothetical protein [Catellatospora sichuanensis]